MSLNGETARLLKDLAEAKTWPDKFKEEFAQEAKGALEIEKTDKKCLICPMNAFLFKKSECFY